MIGGLRPSLPVVLLVAVVLVLSACGFSTQPTPTAVLTATATPAPTATVAPTATSAPTPAPTPAATATATPGPSVSEAVEGFLALCANIEKNTPLSIVAHGTRAEFIAYVRDEWNKLVPPPPLEAYHAAALTLYDEWLTLPEDAELDMGTPAGQRALEETFKLDANILDSLESSGCVKR